VIGREIDLVQPQELLGPAEARRRRPRRSL